MSRSCDNPVVRDFERMPLMLDRLWNTSPDIASATALR